MLVLAAVLAVASVAPVDRPVPPVRAVAAAPAPNARLENLIALARASQTAVERRDFLGARANLDRLTRAWTAVRPATLRGLKGKALAESFDSHLKWLASAIERENASEVRQVVAGLTRTVHEMEERKGAA